MKYPTRVPLHFDVKHAEHEKRSWETIKDNSKCISCDIWKVNDFKNEIALNDILKLFDGMGSILFLLGLCGVYHRSLF